MSTAPPLPAPVAANPDPGSSRPVGAPATRVAKATPTRGEWIWCLAVPFALAAVLSFAHTPDDGFITLRYAWNLVHGHGPVFNPGEHVLGASSALHLLLSSVVVFVPHSYALVAAKVVSLAFGVAALWQGALLVAAADLPRWARRTGYLALAGSSMLALSSANALETTMYVFLVTLLVRLLVAGRGVDAPVMVGAVAALVVMTRPDGVLFVGALALASLLLERGTRWTRSVRWVLGGVAGAVAVTVTTLVFTGSPFPNTYYAKRVSLGPAFADGARYLQTAILPGVARHGAVGLLNAVLWLALVALVLTGAAVLAHRRTRVAYTVALVGAQVAFILESGGDWMRGGRFLVPALAALVVLALTGAVFVVDRVGRRRPELRRTAMVATAAILFAVTFLPWTTETAPVWQVRGTDDDAFVAVGGYGQYLGVWTTVPHILDCFPGARVATTEIGNVGWADPERPVLDLRGLTDSVIAHDAPDRSRTAAGVALGNWSSPDSVIGRRIVAWRADLVVLLGDEAPMPAMALGGRYVSRARVELADGGAIAVYTRPGLPAMCTQGELEG